MLALDGDGAGREGVARIRGQLEDSGLEVIDLELPADKDPNDLLRERGVTRLNEWFEKALHPKREAAPRWETFGQGFLLELGEVRYEVKMLPPFSSRLRIKLHGQHGELEFLDKLDLYLQRARDTAAARLAKALKLQRFEAETHLKLVLERAEQWVQDQHSQADEAKESEGESGNDPRRTRGRAGVPALARSGAAHPERHGRARPGWGNENAKLLVYLVGLSRKLPKPLCEPFGNFAWQVVGNSHILAVARRRG